MERKEVKPRERNFMKLMYLGAEQRDIARMDIVNSISLSCGRGMMFSSKFRSKNLKGGGFYVITYSFLRMLFLLLQIDIGYPVLTIKTGPAVLIKTRFAARPNSNISAGSLKFFSKFSENHYASFPYTGTCISSC